MEDGRDVYQFDRVWMKEIANGWLEVKRESIIVIDRGSEVRIIGKRNGEN